MTSAIVAIYSGIESISVLVDGAAPNVYGLTGMPNSLPSANLPCRLLLDLANAGEGQSMEFFTVNSGIGGGGAQYVDHIISDLMLLLPLAQGIGVKQVSTTLITYYGAYIDACRANRSLITAAANEANITALTVSPGVYEYPEGSGSMYWGCMAKVTIREIIS